MNFTQWLDSNLADTWQSTPDGPGNFNLPGDQDHYIQDRRFRVEHIHLQLKVSLAQRQITGSATLTLAPFDQDLGTITLDAAQMEILGVSCPGKRQLTYHYDDPRLSVKCQPGLRPHQRLRLKIRYRTKTPLRGLVFLPRGLPGPAEQMWSEGLFNNSHFWFPCHDTPHQKSTWSMQISVPSGYLALANGTLTHTKQRGRQLTYHWEQEVALPPYLVVLIVGRFDVVHEQYGRLPLSYYVPPGQQKRVPLTFGRTLQIISCFERLTGVAYPYSQYSQVMVQEFFTGAMENATLSTFDQDFLVDERARADYDIDFLTAHELAHQWWGNLVTCRHWSHAWLSEGFATYFEALYRRESQGADEFAYYLQHLNDAYLQEAQKYQRAIVTRRYSDPWDIFDRHLYEKAGLVLHQLHQELGESSFLQVVRTYLQEYQGQNADTHDLQRVVAMVTGREMERFFEQWFYRAGHPRLKVNYQWEDDPHLAGLTIEQEQTPVFVLRSTVIFVVGEEQWRFNLHLSRRSEHFHFPLPDKPRIVKLAAHTALPGTVRFTKSTRLWCNQLAHDAQAIDRALAARALARQQGAQVVPALEHALLHDPFWGVRVQAARALGQQGNARAEQALLKGLKITEPRVRCEVVTALGNFRSRKVGEALQALLHKGDPSYFVEAAAAPALAKNGLPTAFTTLRDLLTRPAFMEVMKTNALAGLAILEDERGVELIEEYTQEQYAVRVRAAAARALGKIGRYHQGARIRRRLQRLLASPQPQVRLAVVQALVQLAPADLSAILQQQLDRESEPRIKRLLRYSLQQQTQQKKCAVQCDKLREELQQLRQEQRDLQNRLARWESLQMDA